jgi:hypothetical protein
LPVAAEGMSVACVTAEGMSVACVTAEGMSVSCVSRRDKSVACVRSPTKTRRTSSPYPGQCDAGHRTVWPVCGRSLSGLNVLPVVAKYGFGFYSIDFPINDISVTQFLQSVWENTGLWFHSELHALLFCNWEVFDCLCRTSGKHWVESVYLSRADRYLALLNGKHWLRPNPLLTTYIVNSWFALSEFFSLSIPFPSLCFHFFPSVISLLHSCLVDQS